MNFGEQIWCVLSEEMFETFTSIWSYVKENEKMAKSKFEISPFVDNFGIILPWSMHNFLRKSDVYFQK